MATRIHGRRLSSSASRKRPTQLKLLSSSRWRRPTFGEFVERVEHEFGVAAAANGLLLMGIDREESLSPGDIRAICSQLGVPPEDFGV